ALLQALENDHPWIYACVGAIYALSGTAVVIRWGLLPFAVGIFVSAAMFDVTATFDASAWFFVDSMIPFALVGALALCACFTARAGQSPPPVPAISKTWSISRSRHDAQSSSFGRRARVDRRRRRVRSAGARGASDERSARRIESGAPRRRRGGEEHGAHRGD